MASSILRLAVCLAVCVGVGFLGSRSTTPAIQNWYALLAKPPGTPPNWVFPVVWTTLYMLMAVAWWLLWDKSERTADRRKAISLFLIQLAVNASWSPIFFSAKAVGPALLIIVVMVISTVATIIHSRRVNRLAAALLLPYLAWIIYAAYLNGGVWMLNP